MKRAWLAPLTWSVIVETNRQLCLPKDALHKPTRQGYESARQLWESNRESAMTLGEATDFCRRCHQLAPFCNFNGNTFVAVIRKAISTLCLPPDQAALLRSLAGHNVAGTATSDEEPAFEEILTRLGESASP